MGLGMVDSTFLGLRRSAEVYSAFGPHPGGDPVARATGWCHWMGLLGYGVGCCVVDGAVSRERQ